MKQFITKGVDLGKFFRFLFCFSALCAFFSARAATPVNPRGESQKTIRNTEDMLTKSRRDMGATRVRAATGAQREVVSMTRTASSNAIRNSDIVSRVGTRGAVLTRAASNGLMSNVRAARGTSSGVAGAARSATARATAVFNDLNKIGSGYAACRESYATCMDQMCANANDTYRRCFCSDRFTRFREIEDKLDNAMILLQKFQDTNLDAVDKTAAEVNAMYSATVGEAAIKKDTSAAAKALDQINKLLSGTASSTTSTNNNSSLGILSLDFSSDSWENIWDGGGESLFGFGDQDVSTLEGKSLFDAAQRQCVKLTRDSCETDAAFSMSRSSYNILITQDCNTYEKNLNKKRETVAAAVRSAEKYLREARLEEYRTHNSADFNECLDKVRTSILADTACGEGYKRCLDPTGAYINGNTGEAIYSPRLFELEYTINLNGITRDGGTNNMTTLTTDVLATNKSYANWLDKYRNRVERDLDTCRDIADEVWLEFKRNAIIEIAQAQSAKIEEVKGSCVQTMAECYDTQSQALVNFDQNTAKTAAALGRYTARDICYEKVVACAALFGDNTACTFDARGHLTNDPGKCGLTSLLNYVSIVDSINVVEKCESGLRDYFTKLCTPSDGKNGYPYNCRNMTKSSTDTMGIEYVARTYALNYCQDPTDKKTNYADIDARVVQVVDSLVKELEYDVSLSLKDICETFSGGYWEWSSKSNSEYLSGFYSNVYGGDTTKGTEWGYCYKNSDKLMCSQWADTDLYETPLARWNSNTDECELLDGWYRDRCENWLGGYYENSVCYVPDLDQ